MDNFGATLTTDSDVARLVYKARLAEQAERFSEMAQLMKQVIGHKKMLDAEEQKLLSIAYKNYIGRARNAWKVADAARAKYTNKDAKKRGFANDYANELGQEILSICQEVERNLSILTSSASDPASKSMYAKMEADYRRYRCEIEPKESSSAAEAYQRATNVAAELSPSHPTRMGIALNYSVFKYELENNMEEACRIAQDALRSAESDGTADRTRDGFLIVHLLKDNVDLWRSEAPKLKQETVF